MNLAASLTCEDAELLIADYNIGVPLSTEEKDRLNRHLSNCRICPYLFSTRLTHRSSLLSEARPARHWVDESAAPADLADPADPTGGNPRFEIGRCLGVGGMGIVFEAYDRARGHQVALKAPRVPNPQLLALLKREFRVRRDLQDRHLVSLYELFEEDEAWFFTMELVRGVDFLRFARDHRDGGRDHGRLHEAAHQLFHALAVLHGQGQTHRDIKPSNVLVEHDPDIRVVLLDFGLAVSSGDTSGRADVAGTVPYMAPEQANGGSTEPPVDCYGAGVLLFQALTGRFPFRGADPIELQRAKCMAREPPSPRRLVPELPAYFEELCVALLHPAPEQRPTAAEVCAALTTSATSRRHAGTPPDPARAAFVGREAEREVLRSALDETRHGGLVTCLIYGESGIGKTALVQRFLDDAHARDPSIVRLRGRCFDSESIRYNALDDAMDELSEVLRQLDPDLRRALLPRNAWLLARLFSGLRCVPEFQAPPAADLLDQDPHKRRHLAAQALSELLSRIARRVPLVLAIDDLQWADSESWALLTELTGASQAPSILVIATIRVMSAGEVGPVEAIECRLAGAIHRIAVGPLSRNASHALIRTLLPDPSAYDKRLPALVEEAGGHPLFISELAHQLSSHGLKARSLQLRNVLWSRVRRLDEPIRQLLALLATAQIPLERGLVQHASKIEPDALSRTIEHLHGWRLLKRDRRRGIEVYHARIREALVSHLTPEEIVECHRRLALAMEDRPGAEPAFLAHHWHGAGHELRASHYAEQAAVIARRDLAFERAAALYRQALDWGDHDAGARARLLGARGEALADAGLGAQAAEAYQRAAADASPQQRLELARRAAEAWLHAGHRIEGNAALAQVLADVGLTIPSSPQRAIASLLWHRTMLLWERRRAPRRPQTAASAEQLQQRIDACFSAANGFTMYDTYRASLFQTRHLRLAIRSDDPGRTARALFLEAVHQAARGTRKRAAADALITRGEALARQPSGITQSGFAEISRCAAAYLCGDWRQARRYGDAAESLLEAHRHGVAAVRLYAQVVTLWSMHYLGEHRQFVHRVDQRLDEAQRRGDRYALMTIQGGVCNLRWLLSGDIGGAQRAYEASVAGISFSDGYHMQYQEALLARANLDLYVGEGDRAWQDVQSSWPALRRTLMLEFEITRIESLHLRARSALASHGPLGMRLRHAEADARRLLREHARYAVALGQLTLAGVAASREDLGTSADHLRQAEAGFTAADMQLLRAIARYRRGRIMGGNHGRMLVQASEAWMQVQGIACPERTAAMMAPGFGD